MSFLGGLDGLGGLNPEVLRRRLAGLPAQPNPQGMVGRSPVQPDNQPMIGRPSLAPAPQLPVYNDVNDFDFNRQYTDQVDQLQRGLLDSRANFDIAGQQDSENYQNSLRNAQQQATRSLDANTERFADNGRLRSGAAMTSAGQIGQGLQDQMTNYNRQRTDANTAREQQYAQIQRQVQEQLGRLQEDRTRQQQMLEQDRARQSAEAQAAQQAAQRAQQALPAMTETGQYQPSRNANNSSPSTIRDSSFSQPRSTLDPRRIGQDMMPMLSKLDRENPGMVKAPRLQPAIERRLTKPAKNPRNRAMY